MHICKYCNCMVNREGAPYRNAAVHTYCVLQQPYDIIVDKDKFHLRAHSELLSSRELTKLISKLSKI